MLLCESVNKKKKKKEILTAFECAKIIRRAQKKEKKKKIKLRFSLLEFKMKILFVGSLKMLNKNPNKTRVECPICRMHVIRQDILNSKA